MPRTNLMRLEATATLSAEPVDFRGSPSTTSSAAAYRSAQWATRAKIEAIAYEITNAYLALLQSQKLVALAADGWPRPRRFCGW